MGGIMVHGLMIYHCRECRSRFVMYLEMGVADDIAHLKPWKPVPYGMTCPFCKGVHAFDVSGLVPYSDRKYHELPEGESYFANVHGKEYGVPTMSESVRKLIAYKDGGQK